MDQGQIDQARGLLTAPDAVARPWSLLGAALAAAFAAVLMAGVVVLGPGVRFDPPAVVESR